MSNILAQATYTGLTSLLMISRIINELPDFPIMLFASSVGELNAVTTSLDNVRVHPHFMLYSSQDENNLVKSTLYKHTAYISMRLLISLECSAEQENFPGLRYKTKSDS